LSFALPRSGNIQLDVLDVQGRRVRVLLNARFEAGRHVVNWNARGLDAGVYFVRLTLDDQDTREVKLSVVR
jgi:hypothetical protein